MGGLLTNLAEGLGRAAGAEGSVAAIEQQKQRRQAFADLYRQDQIAQYMAAANSMRRQIGYYDNVQKALALVTDPNTHQPVAGQEQEAARLKGILNQADLNTLHANLNSVEALIPKLYDPNFNPQTGLPGRDPLRALGEKLRLVKPQDTRTAGQQMRDLEAIRQKYAIAAPGIEQAEKQQALEQDIDFARREAERWKLPAATIEEGTAAKLFGAGSRAAGRAAGGRGTEFERTFLPKWLAEHAKDPNKPTFEEEEEAYSAYKAGGRAPKEAIVSDPQSVTKQAKVFYDANGKEKYRVRDVITRGVLKRETISTDAFGQQTKTESEPVIPLRQVESPELGAQPPAAPTTTPEPTTPAPTAPAATEPLTVIGNPPGMISPGNIDLNNRPVIQNADGSHSTEFSTSFGTDKGEVLVPTIVNGRFLTPDGKKPTPGSAEEKAMFERAREHYERTGENLGIFDTPANADAYANTVHNRQDQRVATIPGLPLGSKVYGKPEDIARATRPTPTQRAESQRYLDRRIKQIQGVKGKEKELADLQRQRKYLQQYGTLPAGWQAPVAPAVTDVTPAAAPPPTKPSAGISARPAVPAAAAAAAPPAATAPTPAQQIQDLKQIQAGTEAQPLDAQQLQQLNQIQANTGKKPLDALGHIPESAKVNPLLRQYANRLLDGADIDKMGLRAQDKAAAGALAEEYGYLGQGFFTPKDKLYINEVQSVLTTLMKGKSPQTGMPYLNVLNDAGSRAKVLTQIGDPTKESLWTQLSRVGLQKIFPATSPENEFANLYLNAVSRISGLSGLTRSGRATEGTIHRMMLDLPHPANTVSSEQALQKLQLLQDEIDIAMQSSHFRQDASNDDVNKALDETE